MESLMALRTIRQFQALPAISLFPTIDACHTPESSTVLDA
jgi:hypothetical protein